MFDSLHIMVQLTGPGGNGKSTIIEFLMSFWDQKDIGVIPNNAQKTFPFEQAINSSVKLTCATAIAADTMNSSSFGASIEFSN